MDTLPRDPFMLYSYINMKLRDQYPTLDELCASEDIDKATLITTLTTAGFTYDKTRDEFKM
ncbi:MAG: DUF4250 domain-containing protein [Duncaniella sp.]|nr:DUF4250 domain-containing protein [Duncaniella sp.]